MRDGALAPLVVGLLLAGVVIAAGCIGGAGGAGAPSPRSPTVASPTTSGDAAPSNVSAAGGTRAPASSARWSAGPWNESGLILGGTNASGEDEWQEIVLDGSRLAPSVPSNGSLRIEFDLGPLAGRVCAVAPSWRSCSPWSTGKGEVVVSVRQGRFSLVPEPSETGPVDEPLRYAFSATASGPS
jgi:hypothetical protein